MIAHFLGLIGTYEFKLEKLLGEPVYAMDQPIIEGHIILFGHITNFKINEQ